MGYSDYDPRVCFDDVEGFSGGSYYVGADEEPQRDPLATAGAILRRARQRHRRRRVGARPVIGVTDTTRRTFRPRLQRQVVGADAVNAPVFNSLVQKFSQGVADPKLARVDDVQSYADFRAERRQPYIEQLEQRLAALELAFQQHAADNHGAAVAWLNAELRRHLAECACGGEPIALPVPEVRSGQIECWRDGDEILCTVRVLSPAGVRMVTSGTPITGHANEVAACAAAEGISRSEVLGGAGAVAVSILGAATLVEEVCEAAPELVQCCGGRPGTVLGVVPAADPVMAASMSLLQKCQQGDWTAVADARRLMSERPRLVREAGRRLTMAQRMKAQGRLQ